MNSERHEDEDEIEDKIAKHRGVCMYVCCTCRDGNIRGMVCKSWNTVAWRGKTRHKHPGMNIIWLTHLVPGYQVRSQLSNTNRIVCQTNEPTLLYSLYVTVLNRRGENRVIESRADARISKTLHSFTDSIVHEKFIPPKTKIQNNKLTICNGLF